MSIIMKTAAFVLLLGAEWVALHASEAISIHADGNQPRVAVVGERVAVAYASGESIMIAMSSDGGATYAAPTKVAVLPGLMAGMRRGPQLAMTAQSIVIAAISSKDGNIVAWHSRDSGATWAGPTTVNDRAKSAQEGLFSLAAGKDDTVWAAWLDLRQGPTKVVMSVSTNGGSAWSPNAVLYQAPDGAVCECCQPNIAADASGAIAVMWRNHIGEARDMWLVSSSNSGKTFSKPAKLGGGTWTLNACPMDGGGVAVSGRDIQTIWRRDGTMFSCAPADKQETELGAGKNGSVALAGAALYRAWQNGESIMLALADGKPKAIGPGSYPHLGAAADGKGPVILTWQDGKQIKALRLDR